MKRWTWWFLLVLVLVSSACAGLNADKTAHPAALAAAEGTSVPVFTPHPLAIFLPPETPPVRAENEFRTDFSRHTVSYGEILSGGPPKDGIPAIDSPRFVSAAEADEWLAEVEPVVMVAVGEDVRAYPIQILMWHEIVNDEVGGKPLMVSFCPLCNTAIAFERSFAGQVLDFGTTGRLRFSNLIMYDRQTESWWQQASGTGIAGAFAGGQLVFYPAAMISWAQFKQSHPDGRVLSRDTGYSRDYGNNPYGGYDDINAPPFLYDGPAVPGQMAAVERVLAVDLGGEAVAYPWPKMQELRVVNDVVGENAIVVLWSAGTASALDANEIAEGRDVGAAVAFSRSLDGQTLTFRLEGDTIVDDQTGSEWNVLGRSMSGALAGKQLEPVVAINHFWFSWSAFRPDTRVYEEQ